MTNIIQLKNRAIIEIKGRDGKKFLQGLITNDINKIGTEKLIYAAMLNNQGRFLYDFFIFENDDTIFLDCEKSRIDEIVKKLGFYKLRADVVISKNENLQVFVNLDEKNKIFQDPRNPKIGQRFYSQENQEIAKSDELYHRQRICQKIAESENDLTYEKSIIAEFGFDDLGAINYEKGCYIGQELTARTHHLGQIRKTLYHVTIANCQEIEKNHEISCQGKKAGIILSSLFFDDELHALALIKNNENATEFFVNNNANKLTIIK